MGDPAGVLVEAPGPAGLRPDPQKCLRLRERRLYPVERCRGGAGRIAVELRYVGFQHAAPLAGPGQPVPPRSSSGPELGESSRVQSYPEPVQELLVPVFPEGVGFQGRDPLNRFTRSEADGIGYGSVDDVGAPVDGHLEPALTASEFPPFRQRTSSLSSYTLPFSGSRGCRVADSLPDFSDSPVYIPNKPPQNPATLQPEGAEDVAQANADVGDMQSPADAATGDLPFHGPEP